MKEIIPTLVVAFDELSRAGLFSILHGGRCRPITTKGGWQTAILSDKPVPGIIILVLDGMMADEAVKSMIETMAAKQSKVVILADPCDGKLVRGAIGAGAVACLHRSVSAETLLKTLDLVIEGEAIFPASVVSAVIRLAELEPESIHSNAVLRDAKDSGLRDSNLTSRETEILKRLVQGESNKQISRQLTISETTVKVHVKAILRKVRLRNRTQAAIWGLAHLGDGVNTPNATPQASESIVAPAPEDSTRAPPAAPNMKRNGYRVA